MPNKIKFNPFTSSFDLISEVALTSVGSTPNSSAASIDSNQNLSLEPADASNPGVLTSGTQTIGGDKTFAGNISAANLSGTNAGDVTLTTVGSSPNNNAASLIGQQLQLQPSDSTHPGIVSTTTQSFSGSKTFDNNVTITGTINADGSIDRSTSGNISIGGTNATSITIGNPGTTVSIQGTTIYENTPVLQVVDPLITVNKNGGAGSGGLAGIEIEEASSITAYVETSADRNSWTFKAPATAGVATITPGSGGITLDQSSHSPVTLTAVGSSPNANGASLSGQALTLQPADNTNPGVISAGTQNIPGSKNFLATAAFLNGANVSTGNLNVTSTISTNTIDTPSVSQTLTIGNSLAGNVTLGRSGQTVTVNTLVTGPVRATSGALSTGNTSLATEVTGTLPIANGGTNSSTGLNNDRHIVSSGGAIVETAAATNGQLLIGSTSAAPVIASLTAGTGISITNGAGSITINSTSVTPTGDIGQSSFVASQTQTNATLTGLAFANATIRSFEAQVSVAISATSPLFESFNLRGLQRASDWQMSVISVGDASGFSFSINSSGQVLYSSGTYTGFTSAAVRFRAETLLT